MYLHFYYCLGFLSISLREHHLLLAFCCDWFLHSLTSTHYHSNIKSTQSHLKTLQGYILITRKSLKMENICNGYKSQFDMSVWTSFCVLDKVNSVYVSVCGLHVTRDDYLTVIVKSQVGFVKDYKGRGIKVPLKLGLRPKWVSCCSRAASLACIEQCFPSLSHVFGGLEDQFLYPPPSATNMLHVSTKWKKIG